MRMQCPVCLSDNCPEKYELYDDRFGFEGVFKLKACITCGHKFIEGDFTPELLTKLYSEYYPRSTFSLEKYKPYKKINHFKAWLDGAYFSAFRWVPENVRVLDIGCGFGETLGYHKARGCDVYGVEADKNILRVAEKFGYNVHVGLFNPDLYEPDFFDYVTMDQVLEHTTDPVETLKGVARVLKPGGAAVVSLPNSNGWGARVFGRKWINWHVPYHIQHFSLESMRIAAEKAGLKIEEHRTITNSDWLFCQWIHLVTYPKQGVRSYFWSPIRTFRFRLMIMALIFLLHQTKIDHLITRLFDTLELGDNFVFILRKA